MKDTITRTLAGYRQTFAAFAPGQKVIAIIGTAALLLGGFMVFRWASTPSYSPLFSNLSASDASAVVQELDAKGVPYELADGGNTVMVPKDAVYQARIDLAGEGLPSDSGDAGGYSLLDGQSLMTSDRQEAITIKRAIEGELETTIEQIDGVDTAVVHLAVPEKVPFTDAQDPTTASVLVAPQAGTTLNASQVQAIVHLVASGVDGLEPANVTVADSAGQVLSNDDGSGGDATSRDQEVEAVRNDLQHRLQAMLDRVVGVGNSTVEVTPVLDFDKSVTETTRYTPDDENPVVSSSEASETYTGPDAGAASGAGGVVGPDGQMDSGSTTTVGDNSYVKKQTTADRAVGSEVVRSETAPGGIKTLSVGVVLDSATTKAISTADIRNLVADTIGIDEKRGDTMSVVTMPFDRTAEAAAAKEIEAAKAADATGARNDLIRKAGLGGVLLLILLLAMLKGRRRAKQREQATTYVVEQLRQETAARQSIEGPGSTLALEQAERSQEDGVRDELNALIERQPEDVAALLRGWLTERS